jgi:hypothetical protein
MCTTQVSDIGKQGWGGCTVGLLTAVLAQSKLLLVCFTFHCKWGSGVLA